MITVEAGHFRSHGEGERPEGSLTEMFGATFSGPHGELFTVLIDPRPDHFVIQVDEPEKALVRGRRGRRGTRAVVHPARR